MADRRNPSKNLSRNPRGQKGGQTSKDEGMEDTGRGGDQSGMEDSGKGQKGGTSGYAQGEEEMTED